MALISSDTGTGAGDRPDASADMRYRAFLSYSHADGDQADWLHKAIERFAVPRSLVGRVTALGPVPKNLSPIFRDRHELAASSDLGQTIREALGQSRFLIVLCSPAAAASRWVNEEIIAFKQLRGEERVLAAIVAGEPWASDTPGREGEECFPPALREKYDRRGRATGKRAEPIAADLREGRDGRASGKLKLIAGMLGLGLDDLVRREQQRRQKRLTYIAAASIAGMAVTSGLAVFAFDKRDEARDQRREAEGLVGFMLGDLKDKLEPIGKLDALDAVGSKALKYFEQQNTGELSEMALTQRSKALLLMGQIATKRRDLKGAIARYREAMAGTAEMIRRDPNDPDRLFDHAQNIFFLSQVELELGNERAAEAHLRQYKALADQLVRIDPGNRDWQAEVGYAETNLGSSLMRQHRFAEASQQFEAGLRVIANLNASDPKGGDALSLSEALAWLADSRFGESKVAEAITLRRRQVDILKLAMSRSNDVRYRERAIPALRALGRLLIASDDVGNGLKLSGEAVEIAQNLMPIEPTNLDWVELAAGAKLDLGAALLIKGSTEEAASRITSGCALVARLAGSSVDTTIRRELKLNCLTKRTDLAIAGRKLGDAVKLGEQSVIAARNVQSADKVKNAFLLASAYKVHGEALFASGREREARFAWSSALERWPALAAGPRSQKLKAALLKNLGADREASRIEQRLNVIGYRNLI